VLGSTVYRTPDTGILETTVATILVLYIMGVVSFVFPAPA